MAETTARISQVPRSGQHVDVAALADERGYAGRYVSTEGTDQPIAGDAR